MLKDFTLSLELEPTENRVVQTAAIFWSHDVNTAKIYIELLRKGTPIILNKDVTVRVMMLFDDENKSEHIYTAKIEDELKGLVSITLEESMRAYVGQVTCGVYVDYQNEEKTDNGYFTFGMRRSLIDKDMPELQKLYVSDFEKALENFKEIEDKIERNDLVTTPDLKNYTHNKMFLDEKFSSLDNRNDDLYKNKADKNYVESELNSKVDKSYVYTELDKKANKKEFEKLASEARLKQDDIKMNDLSQDVKEAMTGGSVAVVGVDSVGETNIKNGSVTPIKTSFFTGTTNHFDYKNEGILYKKGFSMLSGNIVDDSQYNITHFISSVTFNTVHLGNKGEPIVNTQFYKIAFYDKDKTHIQTLPYDLNGVNVISKAHYFRVQYLATDELLQVEPIKVSSYNSFHFPVVKEEHIPKLKTNSVEPLHTTFFKFSKNLFNGNDKDILFGKGYVYMTGNIKDDETYNISHFIKTEHFERIFLGDKGFAIAQTQYFKIAFYNEGKKHMKTVPYSEDGVPILKEATYFRVQYRSVNTLFQIQSSPVEKYESYYEPQIKKQHLPNNSDNEFESIKKFVSYGDSLTFREKWQPYIYAKFNFQHANHGIGSTTVALVPEHEAEFPSLVNEKRLNNVIAEEPDLLTINGGTNDKHRGVPIGNLDELSKPLENKNKETFYGAYSFLIETVLSKLPECKIILINAPQADFKRWAFDYTEFAEATKKIALYYSLPYADWHGKTGVNKINVNSFTIDGLHQNEQGGLRAANSVIEAMNVYKDN